MKLSKSWYDVILLMIVYLITSTQFYAIYIDNSDVVFYLTLSLRLGFILFAYFFIKQNLLTLPLLNKSNWKTLLIAPLFLLTFSNILIALMTNVEMNQTINPSLIVQNTTLAFLVSIAEELVFRVVLFAQFKKHSKLISALFYSSLVFALIHLVGINSIASIIPVLIQVVYTFFLGLACVLIYHLTQNFIYPTLFHFSFNVLNGILFTSLYNLPNNWRFYLLNSTIGLLCLVYGIWLYRFSLKKGISLNVT